MWKRLECFEPLPLRSRLLAQDAALNDPRHGPLPAVLLALTVLTGLVDAVSFLRLGHVFVSNMTGNVVFLGFALAGAGDIAPLRSLVAIVAFILGSALAGRLSLRYGAHRGRLLSVVLGVESMLVALILLASLAPLPMPPGALIDVQVSVLAIAMGIQTTAARLLGVPDLTTTVVTLTMTALGAESFLGTGTNRNARRRSSAIVAMFAGALLGGALVLHRGVAPALTVALATLAGLALAVSQASARNDSTSWAKMS